MKRPKNILNKKLVNSTVFIALLVAAALIMVPASASLQNQVREKESMTPTDRLAGRPQPVTIRETTQNPVIYDPAKAYNAYDPSGSIPVGPVEFNLATPGTITSLATSTTDFIAGGTWSSAGEWFGVEYGTGALYEIDPTTGAMTLIGGGGTGLNGLAWDPVTDVMYGCSSTALYTIDPATGAQTMVGSLGSAGLMIGMDFDSAGVLYGADLVDDNLYTIDTATGAATVVGSLGISINYAQDMGYDHDNDVMYFAAYTTQGELYTVDTATGACTIVGAFAGGMEVTGFAIPWVAGPPPDHDVGVSSIIEPVTGDAAIVDPKVTVKNYGNASEVTDVQLEIGQFAPPVTLFTEDFEAGYAGWTIVDGGDTTDTWTDTNPGGRTAQGGCSGTFMSVDSDYAGSGIQMQEQLISPSFDCSGAMQVIMDFSMYYQSLSDILYLDISTDGGVTWTTVQSWTSTTTGPITGVDLTAFAAGQPDVKIRFYYDNLGVWAWYTMVDNIEIYQLGGLVTEYSETVTGVSVPMGETVEVTFPTWTPAVWQMVSNIDITYEVIATTLLVDDNPDNDEKTKSVTYSYPYLHDVELVSIDSPITSGPGAPQDVKVTIKNNGQFQECCFKTHAEIGAKVFTDAWTSIRWGGDNDWIQYNYGDHSYEPSDCGCGNYYAGTYYTQGGTFDTSLVTFPIDLSGLTSATIQLCEQFQDFAGYGQFGIYVHSGGMPDASGTGSSNYEETLYYMTSDEIPRYGIYRIFSIDPSMYADPSQVYLEFWYTDDGYGNAWGAGIDCLEIPEIGFYEDFEGNFPPADFVTINEYDEEFCVPSGILIEPGEEMEITFDQWIPDALAIGDSGSIEYEVKAYTDLDVDENPANDMKTVSITLDYWHDVSVNAVTSPTAGRSDMLWDNYEDAADSTLLSSQYAANYPFNSHVADDFVLGSTATLDHVKVWGGFWNGDPVDPCDITIYIFEDDGGVPTGAGTQDPSSTAIFTHTETAVATPSAYAYVYEFDIPGVTLTGGETYWLSVQAAVDFPPQFGWTTNGANPDYGADPVQGFPLLGTNYWTPVTDYGDMAFQLYGIEGGSPTADLFIAPGVQTVSVEVENSGTFDETGLTATGKIYEFITNETVGTLVWEDEVTGIDLDVGEEDTITFGTTYDFAIEGIYRLIVEMPLGNDDYPNNNDIAKGIGVDDTGPVSDPPVLDPASPDGANGWYVSDVTVTLTADDGTEPYQSGVDHIEYRIDGGGWQSVPNGGSFDITTNGQHTIEYKAVDAVGNEESPVNSFDVDMDQDGPTIDLTWEAVGGVSSDLIFTATCDDVDSGMDYVEFYMNDVLQFTDDAAPYSWQMTHTSTKYTIKAVAYDLAGNTAEDFLESKDSHAQTQTQAATVLAQLIK